MRVFLYWLHLPQGIIYRVCAICLLGSAPAFLKKLCCATSDVRGRCFLRPSAKVNILSLTHELYQAAWCFSFVDFALVA